MELLSPLQLTLARAPVVAEGDQQKRAANEYEASAGGAHDIDGDGAVLARRRIVVIAEQQGLIDRAAAFFVGRFDQAQADIARRIIDAVKVLREFALGSD